MLIQPCKILSDFYLSVKYFQIFTSVLIQPCKILSDLYRSAYSRVKY